MEKRKPTYDLGAFKLASDDVVKLNATSSAIKGALALGFSRTDIVEIIQTMQTKHFYKSMTSYVDHRLWQDVYYVPSAVGLLYVKFTADTITEFVLLSFKEK